MIYSADTAICRTPSLQQQATDGFQNVNRYKFIDELLVYGCSVLSTDVPIIMMNA